MNLEQLQGALLIIASAAAVISAIFSIFRPAQEGRRKKMKQQQGGGGDEVALEVEAPGGWKARVQGIIAALFLIGGAGLLLLYAHHTTVQQDMSKAHSETMGGLNMLKDAVDANTYVLALPQSEREKLNITMPRSLRDMRGRGSHRNGINNAADERD